MRLQGCSRVWHFIICSGGACCHGESATSDLSPRPTVVFQTLRACRRPTAQVPGLSIQQGALILGQIHKKHTSYPPREQRHCLPGPSPQCQAHSTLSALGSSPTTSGSLPDSRQTSYLWRQSHLLRSSDAGTRAERSKDTPEYNVRTSLSPSPSGTSCREENETPTCLAMCTNLSSS
jgi:hypothetical protein